MLAKGDPPAIAIGSDFELLNGHLDRARAIQTIMTLLFPLASGKTGGRLKGLGVEREVGGSIFFGPGCRPACGGPFELGQSRCLSFVNGLLCSAFTGFVCRLVGWLGRRFFTCPIRRLVGRLVGRFLSRFLRRFGCSCSGTGGRTRAARRRCRVRRHCGRGCRRWGCGLADRLGGGRCCRALTAGR